MKVAGCGQQKGNPVGGLGRVEALWTKDRLAAEQQFRHRGAGFDGKEVQGQRWGGFHRFVDRELA